MPVLDLLKTWTDYGAGGVEAIAGVVIILAAIEGGIRALLAFLRPNSPSADKELIRLRLGRWLTLGLEFELAADILRSAVAPTWNEIGQLASIVVLRTVLNYFLQRDIDNADQHQRTHEPPPPPS